MRPWRANDPNKARRVRESCAETMRYTQHGERVGREGGIAATKQARSANALYRLGWSKERQAKVSAHRHSFLLATTAASLPLSVPPFFILLRALSRCLRSLPSSPTQLPRLGSVPFTPLDLPSSHSHPLPRWPNTTTSSSSFLLATRVSASRACCCASLYVVLLLGARSCARARPPHALTCAELIANSFLVAYL